MSGRRGGGRGRRAFASAVLLALLAGPAEVRGARAQAASCVPGQICTSSGADVADLAPIVQRRVAPYLTAHGIAGAVVGVSWKGRRSYFGYGYSDPGRTRPYGPDTVVEIGSITKVFTTALFEEAVAEGRVPLEGRLRDFAGPLGTPPFAPCGGQTTLRQLADFSSGMPRLPDVPRPAPDIRGYTAADFLRWLSGWTPRGAEGDPAGCGAGAAYEYSNASVGVLGLVLSAVYQKPWFELVERRITAPLGMDSTFFDVPAGQAHRVAQGFAADGSPAPPWPVYAWFASGVLKSDAADMLSFGEAALGEGAVDGAPERAPAVAALEAAIAAATVPVYVASVKGNTFGQGLAWEELIPAASQSPIDVKNGGTSGFSTAIAINRAKGLAVFVAFPRNGASAQAIGVGLVRRIGFRG